MARAREPRPRVVSAAFGAYFILLVLVAYLISPQLAGYVDPGATFWICTGYVLLGALAISGICAGAIARARTLDSRILQLETVRRRVQQLEHRGVDPKTGAFRPAGSSPVDSGSAEVEVDELLDGLESMSRAVDMDEDTQEAAEVILGRPTDQIEGLLKADAWEIVRVRKARGALAAAAVGPLVAAIALVGTFAPLLPAANGMLISNLQLNAFLGVVGIGTLAGIAAYAVAAFRQVRPWTP